MPSNSKEYQAEYRKTYNKRNKNLSVGMSLDVYAEITAYAASQGFSASTMLREATLHQIRGTQIRSKAIETELQELRFLLSNIANNMNQIAHHSNRVKHVVEENGVLQRFAELDELLVGFVNSKLKPNP